MNNYRIPRYMVSLVRDGSVKTCEKVFTDSKTARDIMLPAFEGLDREIFVVWALDAKHRVIGLNVVSSGSLTMAIVHPREVLKPLILLNACAYICAHNHPSGDSTPSEEDTALTDRLKAASYLMGIPLLDHIVIGDGNYYSYADEGRLR